MTSDEEDHSIPDIKEWITVDMLREAIWEAYFHNELDEIAGYIEAHYIDGNDHPLLTKAAQSIYDRL